MFDLITQGTRRPLRERSLKSKAAATLTHAAALTALVVVPVFRFASVPPQPRTILTFVATSLAPPPLPPPPPAPMAPQPPKGPAAPERPVVVQQPAAATESSSTAQREHNSTGQAERVAGLEGVEGGVPGGVTGGIVEGTTAPASPSPPSPAPPPSAAPVRVGGPIKVPGLLRRVEPIYSPVAAASHLGGVVILEAVVDANGGVESVKVLRSASALLDNAAVDALKQWRYSALVLNGVPTPFVVTVTFRFNIA